MLDRAAQRRLEEERDKGAEPPYSLAAVLRAKPVPPRVRCAACGFTRDWLSPDDAFLDALCPRCYRAWVLRHVPVLVAVQVLPCPACQGVGQHYGDYPKVVSCTTCGETGYVDAAPTAIPIPAEKGDEADGHTPALG